MHIGTLYGDQSVFVLRSVFFEIGGFEGLPLMEDVNFSSKLRDYGNVRVLTPKIRSSKRKFSRDGTLQRKLKNMWLIILYRLGVSPYKLAEMYYMEKHGLKRSQPDKLMPGTVKVISFRMNYLQGKIINLTKR